MADKPGRKDDDEGDDELCVDGLPLGGDEEPFDGFTRVGLLGKRVGQHQHFLLGEHVELDLGIERQHDALCAADEHHQRLVDLFLGERNSGTFGWPFCALTSTRGSQCVDVVGTLVATVHTDLLVVVPVLLSAVLARCLRLERPPLGLGLGSRVLPLHLAQPTRRCRKC